MTLDEQMQRLREPLGKAPPMAVQPPTVEEVMARVRAEVARRRASTPAIPEAAADGASVAGAPVSERLALPRWSPAAARLAYRSEYRLDDLLVFSDRDFVEQCFRIVLRRQPDAGGLSHFLDRLRRGELSKVEVLGEIRFSPEGRQRGVHVDGLLLPYTLQRWGRQQPFGRFLRWAQGLFRIGAFQHRLNQQDAAQGRDVQETGQVINQVASQLEEAWRRRDEQMERLQHSWSEALAERPVHADLQSLMSRLDEIQSRDREARDDVLALRDALEVLRDGLAGAKSEHEAALAALAAKHADAQRHVAQVVAGVVKQDALDAVAQAARRAEARAAAAESRAAALASELAAARSQYATLRGEWRKALEDGLAEQSAVAEDHARLMAEARAEAATAAEGLHGAVSALRAELDERAAAMRHDVGHQHQGLAVVVDALKDELAQLCRQQGSVGVFERRMLEDSERLERRLASLDAGIPPLLQRFDHEAARIDGLDARIRPVEEALTAASEERLARVESLDALYAAFEDRFRGSRELIHSRIRPYLEWVREAGAGSREAPVLDVGCGRGEWLEMLRDAEMHGRGIDLNRLFVDACRGRGLEVDHADALQALRAMPEASVGALTSMHLVEHLPFETVIALLDEAKRVLRPGGLLVLETPNPENLLVGACTFYMDPTHRNPIPPEALRWIVEARGFHAVRIERLSVGRDLARMVPIPGEVPGAETINALSGHFTAAPDYAVLGRRP